MGLISRVSSRTYRKMRFNLRPRKWMTQIYSRLSPDNPERPASPGEILRESSPKSSRRRSRKDKIGSVGQKGESKSLSTCNPQKSLKLSKLSPIQSQFDTSGINCSVSESEESPVSIPTSKELSSGYFSPSSDIAEEITDPLLEADGKSTSVHVAKDAPAVATISNSPDSLSEVSVSK